MDSRETMDEGAMCLGTPPPPRNSEGEGDFGFGSDLPRKGSLTSQHPVTSKKDRRATRVVPVLSEVTNVSSHLECPMAFTVTFGGEDGFNHVVNLDAPTLAAAKREFYRTHARFGGVFDVRFTEVDGSAEQHAALRAACPSIVKGSNVSTPPRGGSAMSVSSRSPKAVMYSEIERLRALLDQRDNQIASLEEKVLRREAKIEELSASLTLATQQHRTTCAELSAEKAAHADTYERLKELERAPQPPAPQPPAPQPSAAPLSERRTRLLMMKRLAITCKASVKWVDGQGFRQYKDGRWVAIPTHTIEFIAKGISQ